MEDLLGRPGQGQECHRTDSGKAIQYEHKRGIEVDTLKKSVDLNESLSSRRKGTLGMLASSAKTMKQTRI